VFPDAREASLTAARSRSSGSGIAAVVVAYRQEMSFSGANRVIVDPLENSIAATLRYKTTGEAFATVIEE
jgi:hypothetical protein